MSDELLPCPCCGGEAHFDEVPVNQFELEGQPSNAGGQFVECSKCGLSTNLMFPLMDDVKGELAERWNRRAHLAQPEAAEPVVLIAEDADKFLKSMNDGWHAGYAAGLAARDAIDSLDAAPVAAQPTKHFDACPDGKTCVSTTTGCRPGQCFYRRAKFYPDGSFSISVAAQQAEAESIPAMTIRFAAEAWAAYGLDTALVGDDQFHRAWQATCAAANAGYFAALRPAPASGLADELEQFVPSDSEPGDGIKYGVPIDLILRIISKLRGQP